jgi:hypothetical protein
VNHRRCTRFLLILVGCLCPFVARSQIDPYKRSLVQFGYNAALEGHSPLSAYAFYYRNEPEFISTNLTLRLAVAPTYADSELGVSQALGEHTDMGFGLAGGAFADNYYEIQKGTYLPSQSFTGYGVEPSVSLYHLFNPGQRIPLNGLLRGSMRYSTYDPSTDTASTFQVPGDRETFNMRTGLRWGGREPVLAPTLAMELSGWYEAQARLGSGTYGFDGDRKVEPASHLFWGEAFLAYTLPKSKHTFSIDLSAGTSLSADRFSAYRLGSLLPLATEFPLSLPGYYYQELSAKNYALMRNSYTVPLDPRERWNITATGSAAWVDYLPGFEQPGNWHTGLGAGVLYKSPSWKIMTGYAYGFNAIRSNGRGAQSLWILLQLDLERAHQEVFSPEAPGHYRGLQNIFDFLGL